MTRKILTTILALIALSMCAWAQNTALVPGERLTYQISFDQFENAGFAELQIASVGKLEGRDVIELRSKFKTQDLVSATFALIDQTRVTYISPETGLPLYIGKNYSDGPLPKDAKLNFIRVPAFGYDLPSLIYRARMNGGSGTYPLYEDGKIYQVRFRPGRSERLRVDAGQFDTIATSVESEFLETRGLRNAVINFSKDGLFVPVRMTFKFHNGIFRITLSSVSRPESLAFMDAAPVASATPAATPRPVPSPGSRPTPEPTPYVDNRPLPAELNFALGESLNYRVTAAGQPAGVITLSAKERKQVKREDTLLLTAFVNSVDPNSKLLTLGDHIQALVDPETLAPRSVESRFNTTLAGLNQSAIFDQRSGQVTVVGGQPVEAPIGTHTPLSLIYAMRSFNLAISTLGPAAAVNDTRVAVFWNGKTNIFSLHPGRQDVIDLNGAKVLAQPVAITTGDPQLDSLAPKVWLSLDTRVPLRFTAGALQADLIRNN